MILSTKTNKDNEVELLSVSNTRLVAHKALLNAKDKEVFFVNKIVDFIEYLNPIFKNKYCFGFVLVMRLV